MLRGKVPSAAIVVHSQMLSSHVFAGGRSWATWRRLATATALLEHLHRLVVVPMAQAHLKQEVRQEESLRKSGRSPPSVFATHSCRSSEAVREVEAHQAWRTCLAAVVVIGSVAGVWGRAAALARMGKARARAC